MRGKPGHDKTEKVHLGTKEITIKEYVFDHHGLMGITTTN
jgi:hypothetical protein